MKIQFGNLTDSANRSVTISTYADFIAFDMFSSGSPEYAERIAANISVDEAKRIRKELKAAIKSVEGE